MATERRKGARPAAVAADYILPPRIDRIVKTVAFEVDAIARMAASTCNGDAWPAVHALTSRLAVLATAAMSLGTDTPLDDIERQLFPMGDPNGLDIPGLYAPAGLREGADHAA